jgi:hypothetical protein
MQEDLENKSVALSIKTAKLTGKGLAKAMQLAYRQMKKARDKPGEMSFKQLSKGGSLSNIEITDENIKAFDPVARKYGIHYTLQKDKSSEPPLWTVYFRAKEVDSMTAAFKEFSDSVLNTKEKDRPSVRETMRNFREVIKNAVKDITRNKHREGPEL